MKTKKVNEMRKVIMSAKQFREYGIKSHSEFVVRKKLHCDSKLIINHVSIKFRGIICIVFNEVINFETRRISFNGMACNFDMCDDVNKKIIFSNDVQNKVIFNLLYK